MNFQNHSICLKLLRRKHQHQDHFQGDVGPSLLVELGDVQPAWGRVQQGERTAHTKRAGGGGQVSYFTILKLQDFAIGEQI